VPRLKRRAEIGDAERVFWKTVRYHRCLIGILQREFANVIGMNQGNLSRAEMYGRRIPSREVVLKTIETLKLDIIEREELLALAGYSPTEDFYEAVQELVQKGGRQLRYGRFTHSELKLCLVRCIAALLFHPEPKRT
jgi:hypothetical protein